MLFLKVYITALLAFLSIDLLWLGVLASNLYKEQIGFLMTDDVRWGAALLFYALYVFGLVFFVVFPAFKEQNLSHALVYGALFGLICYATYDLTNLATLKNWPLKLTVYDLMWGTFLSASTATVTYLISSYWKSFFTA